MTAEPTPLTTERVSTVVRCACGYEGHHYCDAAARHESTPPPAGPTPLDLDEVEGRLSQAVEDWDAPWWVRADTSAALTALVERARAADTAEQTLARVRSALSDFGHEDWCPARGAFGGRCECAAGDLRNALGGEQ